MLQIRYLCYPKRIFCFCAERMHRLLAKPLACVIKYFPTDNHCHPLRYMAPFEIIHPFAATEVVPSTESRPVCLASPLIPTTSCLSTDQHRRPIRHVIILVPRVETTFLIPLHGLRLATAATN